MKTLAIAAAAAALGLAGCTTIPANSKPYSCKEYNDARAQISKLSTSQQAWENATTARFMRINYVGFKASLDKHPARDQIPTLINNAANLQAMQCRVAPSAVIHYTAEQTKPGSVLLGYYVDYPNGKPSEISTLEGQLKRGSVTEVPNEKGMEPVKQFIRDCASKSAPARVCKLAGA